MVYSLAAGFSGVITGMPALPAASSTGASAAGESCRTTSASYFWRIAWRICWICVWTLLLESCVVTLVITSELFLSSSNFFTMSWMNGVLMFPGEK